MSVRRKVPFCRLSSAVGSTPPKTSVCMDKRIENMAASTTIEHQYFYEDVVYRVDKRGNVEFGIVMGTDDPDSSEESSDEESPKRKKGEIRALWHPSGVEEPVNSKKVIITLEYNFPYSYL